MLALAANGGLHLPARGSAGMPKELQHISSLPENPADCQQDIHEPEGNSDLVDRYRELDREQHKDQKRFAHTET